MLLKYRWSVAALAVSLLCAPVLGQAPAPAQGKPPAPTPPAAPPAPTQAPSPPPRPAPAADAVAAKVNGQPIAELAVYRATLRDSPTDRDRLRKEVLNFLIDNALVDQYLEGLKVAVEPKEVEERFRQVKEEITKSGTPFEKVLTSLHLTEAELRTQILGSLRWDRFVAQYATDKGLKEFFDTNKAMFDGSQVRARHILVKVPADDAKAADAAKAKLLVIRKQVEEQVAAGLKAVAGQDRLKQDEARLKLIEEAFSQAAAKESECPTKKEGGELGWFPRAGRLVEPFARAAFALKPFEMSDVVTTGFGLHLILSTGQKAGRDVNFDTMKEVVKEIYGDRLREAVLARVRPQARIEIIPASGAKQ